MRMPLLSLSVDFNMLVALTISSSLQADGSFARGVDERR